MSESQLSLSPFLVAPDESDESLLRRLEYEDPLDKASIWLHKLIIHRIRDIEAAAPWYSGGKIPDGTKLVSELLNQCDGRSRQRLRYYCAMILKYRQGCAPEFIIKRDHKLARILLERIEQLLPNTETVQLIRAKIADFCAEVTTNDGKRLLRESYEERTIKFFEKITTLFGRISSEFREYERLIKGETMPVATVVDIAKVQETAQATQEAVENLSEAVAVEGVMTRKTVKASAKKVVKEITTKKLSDFDKRGPSSNDRKFQVDAVIARLREFAADKKLLPKPLRNKTPDKWLRQACRETWSKTAKGYPTVQSFYIYCHRNEQQLLSLAGI